MASHVYAPTGIGIQKPAVETAVATLAQQLSKLRADIVAGTHTRFKVPQHLAHSTQSLRHAADAPVTVPSLPNGAAVAGLHQAMPSLQTMASSAHTAPQSSSKRTDSRNDDPRAVLQQKRKDLERILEEQNHQKKAMTRRKTCDQEIVADFDVTEVLRKAHELVVPWTPHETVPANQDASSSDSFDENTFYSSQMNESTTTEEVEVAKAPKRPLRACRFFRDGKPCPYGEKCTFSHDPTIVKKVEAEDQQRAGTNQARPLEQANKRAPSPPRKVSNARGTATDIPVVKDAAAARIAELEEKLRQMTEKQEKSDKQEKPNKRTKTAVVPRAIERPDPEPPAQTDEFGRDRGRRVEGPREDPHDTAIQVVRNHITSPYAPQPAGVLPLAATNPSQISRLQRSYNDGNTTSNGYQTDASTMHSPAPRPQPLTRKKRRRAALEEEQRRNVVPRTEYIPSPGVRIKEEPVSPPPFQLNSHGSHAQFDSHHAHQSNPGPVTQLPNNESGDGAYIFREPVQEQRQATPSRRALTRGGMQQPPRDDTDLRRVVSQRNLQPPPSPARERAYFDQQQPSMRAASSVQYVSSAEQVPPVPHRASMQPSVRGGRSTPRQIDLTTDRPTSMIMAPPARRIVVDQYGNRYVEAPLPMQVEHRTSSVPVSRPRQYDLQYEEISPGGHIVRRAPPPEYDGGQYVQEVSTPTSPQFMEYPNVPKRREVIRLDEQDLAEESFQEPQRLVRYDAPDPRKMERLPRVDDQQMDFPPEQASRVSSVRPQPRLVRLGEHEEPSPRIVRQVSMRVEDYGRPVQANQAGEVYHYEHPSTQQYYYTGQPPSEYDPARPGSSRIVRV